MSEFYRLRLERLERELGALAFQVTHVQWARVGHSARWKPAVNAYRCADQFVICVNLAGVEKESIDLQIEPRRVTLRGNRAPREPPCATDAPPQVLTMEIDYGLFERELTLPEEVDGTRAKADQRSGLLWISLPVRSHS